jgi:transaldolase
MASILEQLARVTVVVADTGDIHSIQKHQPRDATTNPSLITAAAQMPEYAGIVAGALGWSKERLGAGATPAAIVALAVDRLSVDFGRKILEIVPGRVSTEVDARLSWDTAATVAKARELIAMYEAAGVSRDRVLIKIASTWEGIRAAETLEKEGIRTNLTLLFGMHQAIACAEAGVTLISPFVGRILDWHVKHSGKSSYLPHEDPGVVSVTRIYEYYKKHGYETEVMGASFRNAGEILALAGCDLLTIAPKLLVELGSMQGSLVVELDAERARAKDIPKTTMDEAAFRRAHDADRMAKDKLAEGIDGFSKALVALEKLLHERLTASDGASAAEKLFRALDLDGDGFVTREEWTGTDAVFDALDEDGDGRITAAELGAGLGAAFVLQS